MTNKRQRVNRERETHSRIYKEMSQSCGLETAAEAFKIKLISHCMISGK